MKAAFLGLGLMGEPMARNLQKSGVAVTVWNRSEAATLRLQADGAQLASSARAAIRSESIVILMLRNSEVVDSVLERGTSAFAENVTHRIIMNMGTCSPAYSRQLNSDILAVGGAYVECPVSGSRTPAEEAKLVAMTAGHADSIDAVRPYLERMCSTVFDCGEVPNALATKLSVNVFLITMIAGLAEAAHLAKAQGVPLELLQKILNAGPLASPISQMKLQKLVSGDLAAQAAIADVLMNAQLITAIAREYEFPAKLMTVCESLLSDAVARGDGQVDMVGIFR